MTDQTEDPDGRITQFTVADVGESPVRYCSIVVAVTEFKVVLIIISSI